MQKKIFYVSLAVLLMLFAAAPAMASQPKLTYAYGGIGNTDPANPGTRFTTNDIMHARDVRILTTTIGSPWGDFNSVATQNFEFNIVSYTGTGIAHYVNTNPRATIEGIQNFELNGGGLFIYHGPTFTATKADGGTVIISDGKPFTGLLTTGMAVSHGTADGKGVQVRIEFTGVSISGSLTWGLAGKSLSYGTATYWYTGN